jgi:hypothetical protein
MLARIHLGPLRGVKILTAPSGFKQMRYGLWERETYPYIRRAMRDCDWMIDIGAGAGEHCIAFALRTWASPIIAIDSGGDTELLRANLENNGVPDRVTINTSFIGTKETPLDSITVPDTGRGFIKLDADFCELDILKSGTRLLRQGTIQLLVETHSASLETECLRLLHGFGYCTNVIHNAWWRAIIPEKRAVEHNRWLWAEPMLKRTTGVN